MLLPVRPVGPCPALAALGGGRAAGVGERAAPSIPARIPLDGSLYCQGTLVSWPTRGQSTEEFIPIMLIKERLLLRLGPGRLGAEGRKDKTGQDTLPGINVCEVDARRA